MMTKRIVESIRRAWGQGSAHEQVFVVLASHLKPADEILSTSLARRLVLKKLDRRLLDDGGIESILFWFALGPMHLLELRFRFHDEYGEELELRADEGLAAYQSATFTHPRTGQRVEGAEVAARLFPFFILRDEFRRAVGEAAGTA